MDHLASFHRRCRILCAAALCLGLSACDSPLLDGPLLESSLLEEVKVPSLETILSKSWLLGEGEPEMPARQAQPVYCYGTLGVGDCYTEPLKDAGSRLVGYDGPPPAGEPRPAVQ